MSWTKELKTTEGCDMKVGKNMTKKLEEEKESRE